MKSTAYNSTSVLRFLPKKETHDVRAARKAQPLGGEQPACPLRASQPQTSQIAVGSNSPACQPQLLKLMDTHDSGWGWRGRGGG